jgi:uncharacterized membrane protein YbhN (UPF0104 family)
VDLLTRTSILILKLLVVFVLGWVFWPQFRWNEFVASMARTSTAAAVTVLALFGLQAVMAALRWRWILRQLEYPLTAGESIEAWLVGQCASQIVPAVIGGDVARIIRLRRYCVPTAAAVVSVFIDRFAGFVALVMLTAFTVPLLTTYEKKLIPTEIFWVVGLSCLLVALLLLSLRWTANAATFRRIPRLSRIQDALGQVKPTTEGLLLFAAVGLGTNLTVIFSAFLLGRAQLGNRSLCLLRDLATGESVDVHSDLHCGLGRSRGSRDERVCADRRSDQWGTCGFHQAGTCESGARPGRWPRLDRAACQGNTQRSPFRSGGRRL